MNEVKQRFIILILIHVLGGVLVIPMSLGVEIIKSLNLLKWVSISCLFWNVFSIVKLTKSYQNPSLLFYLSFLIFLLIRVFLDLAGGRDFGDTIFFSNYTFSTSVQKRLLVNLIIGLWSWNLGAMVGYMNGYSNRKLKSNDFLFRAGKLFFIVGLLFAFYSYIRIAYDVYNNGYLIRFTENSYYVKSLPLIVLEELYVLGFYMILASRPPNIKIRPFILIYIIGLLLELGSGARGPVLTRILVLIWSYSFLYNYKFSVLKILLIGISMVGLSIVVGAYRLGIDLDGDILLMFFGEFLYNMGISVQVPGYAIVHLEDLRDFGFLDLFARTKDYFNVVLKGIFGNGLYLDIKMQPMHERINYLVNATKARAGMGMGGSYIAEFFLLGREVSQLLGGVIFGYMFNKTFNVLNKSNLGFVLLLIILPSLIYTPRHAIFFFIQAGFVSFVILILYILLVASLKGSR